MDPPGWHNKKTSVQIQVTKTHTAQLYIEQTKGLFGWLKAEIWADGWKHLGRAEVKWCCTQVVIVKENSDRDCRIDSLPALPQEFTQSTEKDKTAEESVYLQQQQYTMEHTLTHIKK